MLLVVALCAVAVPATPATLVPQTVAQWYTRTTNPNKNGLSRFSETFMLPQRPLTDYSNGQHRLRAGVSMLPPAGRAVVPTQHKKTR